MNEQPSPVPGPADGQRTILVVEDEEPIRRILRIALQNRGYRVLLADSGEEALRVNGQHAGPLDLVITDLLMPGMGGGEFVKQMLPSRPGVPILYISGFPGNDATAPPAGNGRTAFVAKPFTPNELLAVVDRLLAP